MPGVSQGMVHEGTVHEGAVALTAGGSVGRLAAIRGALRHQPGSTLPALPSALHREVSLSPGAAPNGAAPRPVGGVDGEPAAGALRRAAPHPAAMQDSSPRHLMLRELNEQEVLASLRDAQLTASESAWAAQGLARALMQAGYARVQVVVNGQQHQQEAADGEGAPNATAETSRAGLPNPDATPGSHHGH